jgi:hypothetical protein
MKIETGVVGFTIISKEEIKRKTCKERRKLIIKPLFFR